MAAAAIRAAAVVALAPFASDSLVHARHRQETRT
jgi:hypothetical protein